MVQRDGGKPVCLLLFLDQELAALLNITATSQRSTGMVMSLLWFKSLLGSRAWTDPVGRRGRSGRTRPVFLGN